MTNSILIPTPHFHIDLAALDALHPVHYSRRLLIFRCASLAQRDAQLAALRVGLQALGLRCAISGGVVTPLPSAEIDTTNANPDWRTILPGHGIELVVKDLRATLPSLEELETSGFPVA
ncbi:uncharacterized protein A1O5_06612 [Cladophialophora psammophila CBS 110553]|uniref:Uncharacterized protein n=1 Tax=Cladophialophora psammophila CBS 110553 TaxID=1182543 RepID=W9WQR7_9EURO|nr:uncharacterized protein A1O5_06612 [Cladophialophora psammophila CBS 110553]EXJ70542.1 hypothetical protein A1O5_06612 [Cladophialophora psammophila CBS 110553]